MHYSDVRTAHTEEFDPGEHTIQTFVNNRIENESDLQRRLETTNPFSRPVYIVVGIQYDMSMTYEITRHASGQGSLGAGGHISSNLDAGATAGGARIHEFYLKDTVRGESIFAYQMLEIRPKGFRRARPPAAVWVSNAALADSQAEDDEGDSDEDVNVQEEKAGAAGEEPERAMEVELSTFQEEHVILI